MDVPDVKYAHRDGRAIAYQTWGAGDRDYLIISEWAANADSVWEHPAHLRVWRFHSALARCLRVDRSGIGSSDPVSDVSDIDAWAEDLLAVLDAEGVDRFSVFGEAWGGHAAIALASNVPDRVDRLVLTNSYAYMPGRDGVSPMDDRELDAMARAVRSAWGTGQVVVNAARFGHDYLDFCARYERLAASPSVAAQMVRAAWTSDVRDRLSSITSPTLVMYSGDYSYIAEESSRFLVDHIAGAQLMEMHGTGYYELGVEVSRPYVGFLTGEYETTWGDRELAVVVFSDIVGSTTELARRGDREWTDLLESSNDTVVREAGRFGGRVVKQTGDGHLLTFRSPGAAMSAIYGMRRAARALGVSLRFGVHMGEIEVREDGDIAGMTVHAAARVVDHAGRDEIVVSRVISDLLAGTGPQFVDLGVHELKGVPSPMQLFAVQLST